MARSDNSTASTVLRAQDFSDKKEFCFRAGTFLLAIAFFVSGISGIMLPRLSKIDFHRCQYVVMEKMFFGDDLNPDAASLESNLAFFNFMFNLNRML